MIARENHLAYVFNVSLCSILEKMKFLTVLKMISDRFVSTGKRHRAKLPFTGIQEDAITLPFVRIPMLLSPVSGKEQDKIMVGRCAYTTLFLSSIFFMKFFASICLTDRKHAPPFLSHSTQLEFQQSCGIHYLIFYLRSSAFICVPF